MLLLSECVGITECYVTNLLFFCYGAAKPFLSYGGIKSDSFAIQKRFSVRLWLIVTQVGVVTRKEAATLSMMSLVLCVSSMSSVAEKAEEDWTRKNAQNNPIIVCIYCLCLSSFCFC